MEPVGSEAGRKQMGDGLDPLTLASFYRLQIDRGFIRRLHTKGKDAHCNEGHGLIDREMKTETGVLFKTEDVDRIIWQQGVVKGQCRFCGSLVEGL